MNIRTIVQTKLDNVLLDNGILSHHIRRVKTDTISGGISVNNDEYVVFRVVSSKRRTYGDGRAKLVQRFVDVNYYYSYEKTDSAFDAVETRVNDIITEFLSDKRFTLANDQSDIYDLDNPYRGINVEFLFVGLVDE
jgi:hypothetical protein